VTSAEVPQKPVPVLPAPPKSAGHRTVLVIEDEPSLRVVVTIALEWDDFTVLTAADGVEGVEVFQQHRDEVQCVLCDLTMPRMGGWETLTALRQLVPGIPFILSSGYHDAKVMADHHPELPHAFLQKPYELKTLIKVINQLLPERRTEKGGESSWSCAEHPPQTKQAGRSISQSDRRLDRKQD